MGKIIIILAMMLVPYAASAQLGTKVVYGQTQTLNDLPVSGISVTSKKAKSTAVSDSLGNFMIVCNEKDRLSFKAKVFHSKKVKINSKTPERIDVKLNFVPTPKNVDLAIGYGYIKESDRTHAIQGRKIDYCKYNTVYDILKDNFTSLQVKSDGCVVMRGPGSFNSENCALYIVDSMKTDNIDYILPCQIEEISVLKDASSAIYGNNGANGVIIINLKKGPQQ